MLFKKYFSFILIFLCLSANYSMAQLQNESKKDDWLINNKAFKATIVSKDSQIIMENGLLRRSFLVSPNIACIDYTNLSTNQQLIRSIEPEAVVVIDNKTYSVGGLSGQKEKAYLNLNWEQHLHANEKGIFSIPKC